MAVDMATTGPSRAGVEVVHESDRTRVTREHVDGRTVIRKEPRGPGARDRLRHELAMLDRLHGVDGVVQLATTPSRPGSIVLEDVDGVSMARDNMTRKISHPRRTRKFSGLSLIQCRLRKFKMRSAVCNRVCTKCRRQNSS